MASSKDDYAGHTGRRMTASQAVNTGFPSSFKVVLTTRIIID